MGVIPVQEVLELLTKINDILNNAVSKWVVNIGHMLAFLFNSAFRQPHEVWASQYPFLHNLRSLFLLVKIAFMAVLTGLGAGSATIFPELVSVFNLCERWQDQIKGWFLV